MKKYLLSIVGCLAVVLMASPVSGLWAQTPTTATPSISDLMRQIESLIKIVENLQQQLAAARPASNPGAVMLRENLSEGMSGEDVSELQRVLARDREVYPEGLVTGYFGTLTKEAVARWQQKNSLSPTGVVNRETLQKLAINPPSAPSVTPPALTTPGEQTPGSPELRARLALEEARAAYSRLERRASSTTITLHVGQLRLALTTAARYINSAESSYRDSLFGISLQMSLQASSVIAEAEKLVDGLTPRACTMDAKMCPDGSFVGRTGPNCEFVCPKSPASTTSSGTGGVSNPLNPTCPSDAFVCPDGTTVGRTGPNCAFASCPLPRPIVCPMIALVCRDGSAPVPVPNTDCEYICRDGSVLDRGTNADLQ